MSNIKQFFESRWDDGYIMEADYSQLEVVILAILSGDPLLIDDVMSKDMHCVSTALLTGEPYKTVKHKVDSGDAEWIRTRKKAKALSFALQYGAGIKALAKNTKLSEDVCKTFVSNYYKRYSRLASFQKELADTVQSTAIPYENEGTLGQRYMGHYYSPTGRKYTFVQHDAPDWIRSKGENFSFSPTEMKNYMTQGTASDIVLMGIASLYRELYVGEGKAYNRLSIQLINTIHDSVMLDVMMNEVDNAYLAVYNSLTGARDKASSLFGIDFPLPLKVDVSVGKTWAQTKPYTPE